MGLAYKPNMPKLLRDWLTEANGKSYCPWNFIGIVSTLAMTYKFIVLPSPGFADFGGAIGAIVVAIAGKRWTEHSEGDPHV